MGVDLRDDMGVDLFTGRRPERESYPQAVIHRGGLPVDNTNGPPKGVPWEGRDTRIA